MARIYTSTALPRYLDANARELLGEGRESFHRYRLHERAVLRDGNRTLLFPWAGDRAMDTLAVWLTTQGIDVTREGVAFVLGGMMPDQVEDELRKLVAKEAPEAIFLARKVENKQREKFHPWLEAEVLAADYAAGVLDIEGGRAAIGRCLQQPKQQEGAGSMRPGT